MGIATELLKMIIAVLAGFVVVLLMPFYYLALVALGATSTLSLLVAVFCGVSVPAEP